MPFLLTGGVCGAAARPTRQNAVPAVMSTIAAHSTSFPELRLARTRYLFRGKIDGRAPRQPAAITFSLTALTGISTPDASRSARKSFGSPHRARPRLLRGVMSGKSADRLPHLFSRRALLHGVTAAVGAAAFLGAAAGKPKAQPKISKAAVAYQDHPQGDKRCERCAQFQPPAACKLVDGAISPQGSCRIFLPRSGTAAS